MDRKVIFIRIPNKLHRQLKEAVAYLETDMTAFVHKLLEKEVSGILRIRDAKRMMNNEE